MSKNPSISVVMPAYNSECYISDAIESILNQEYTDFEFIIVDDASTDGTLEIIESYALRDNRIKVIRNKTNLYIAESLNIGIANSKADIIARMDADDTSIEDRLGVQLELLCSNNNIAVVGGDILIINERGSPIGVRSYPRQSEELKRSILRFSPFAHPATMYRKSAFYRCGGYEPSESPAEDIALWIKIGSLYEFASCPQVVLKYRYHKGAESYKHLRMVEIKTLRIRLRAVIQYKYCPTGTDILYNLAQLATIWLFPKDMRYALFSYIRRQAII